ncbi:MAG: DUF6434 domain-containing protein [Candidatus Methanoplasma sp.]|jgi:hypothetical protein|nr:DUF6434 domain-containing protein [Candidatus Methanoplasma sp.]
MHYLDTGEELPAKKEKRSKPPEMFGPDVRIEENITCSEKHRAFFRDQIGDGFKYNTEFINWLRNSSGKTYAEAVAQFRIIAERRKKGRTEIGRRFEYNRYVRDFFDDNKGTKLEDAVKCWRYKKSIPGPHGYERSDRAVLEKQNDQQS